MTAGRRRRKCSIDRNDQGKGADKARDELETEVQIVGNRVDEARGFTEKNAVLMGGPGSERDVHSQRGKEYQRHFAR